MNAQRWDSEENITTIKPFPRSCMSFRFILDKNHCNTHVFSIHSWQQYHQEDTLVFSSKRILSIVDTVCLFIQKNTASYYWMTIPFFIFFMNKFFFVLRYNISTVGSAQIRSAGTWLDSIKTRQTWSDGCCHSIKYLILHMMSKIDIN